MEKPPSQPKTTENIRLSVAAEANYEGNDSLVMLARVRNPVIREQIIDMLYKQEAIESEKLRNEEWEPHMPEGWTGQERFRLLRGKVSGRIIDTAALDSKLQEPPPTRERIAEDLDKEINHVASVTEIEFSSDEPSVSRMTLFWEMPWAGRQMTIKQKSIVEAHEKGHRIRPYGKELNETFQRGFNPSNVTFTDRDYEIQEEAWRKSASAAEGQPLPSREELREIYFNEYLFTPEEIAERMSQLKNYFGMSGSEKFTTEHIQYAKEHYVSDTGMDNSMRLFLAGITPQNEEAFLDIINTAGI